MVCWLDLRAFQTVLYRITLKTKFHFFYTVSCKIPFKIILNYYFLSFLIFSQLKKKSNSWLTVWYALRPSQQPTVSPNYFQSIKINIGPSDGGTIVTSTHHPTVLYCRLSELSTCLQWFQLLECTTVKRHHWKSESNDIIKYRAKSRVSQNMFAWQQQEI